MPIWLIQIVVAIVLEVASTLMQQATAKPSTTDASAAQGSKESLQLGGTVPQYFVIGTWALAGKREYVNTYGTSGNTPNAYRTEVLSFGDLPITALTGLFEAGQAMTLTSSGHTTQGYPVAERANSGSDRFWEEFFDGTQTTYNTFLNTTFGGDATRPWLPDMIGRGIPYATITTLWDRQIWNTDPSCIFQVQGIKLYDPRKDTTAGGSGTQRLNDQTTWAFTDNLAVMIYNVLVGIRYQNAVVWGGRCAQTQLPYAVWAAAMNACDTSISLVAGGTEKQFRGGRVVQFGERPADVIQDFLIAANAKIAECAGTYTILVGPPGSADGSFTDADTIVTEAATLDPFPNLDNTINGATASYLEPSEAWASKDAPPYYRADLETTDRGRRLATSIDLTNAVFSGTQAQRILKATVEEGRRFLKHVVPMMPAFGAYRPLNCLAWTSAENQYSAKLMLVSAWTEESNGNVILGYQEVDPSDHTWTPGTDEKALSFAPLTPIVPIAQAIADFAVSAADFVDNSGTSRKPGIAAVWRGGQVDVRSVLISVREKNSGNVEWSGELNYATYPTGATLPHAFLPNVTYQVMGQYLAFSGRKMTPSSWLDVTTNNVATALIDLAADAKNLLAKITADARVTLEDMQRNAMATLDIDGGQYTNNQQIRTEVAAAVANASSKASSLVTATVGPGSAIAGRLDQYDVVIFDPATGVGATASGLQATNVQVAAQGGLISSQGVAITSLQNTVNDPTTGLAATVSAVSGLSTLVNSNQVLNAAAITALQGNLGYSGGSATFQMNLGYTPAAGWDSRGGLEFKAPAGTGFSTAGMYFEAKTAGGSRVLVQSSAFGILNNAGTIISWFDTNGQLVNGTISGPGGNSFWNLNTGAFRTST